MTGKQKCNTLRRIRRDIAEANHLDYTERDCTHTGPCAGTCPYCEAQLRTLERKLEEKRSLGRRIAVAGLSLGIVATNLAACDPFTRATGGLMEESLQGDVPASTTEQVERMITKGEIVAETTQAENTFDEQGIVEPLMGDIAVPEMGEVTVPETDEIDLPMPTVDPNGRTVVLPIPEEPTMGVPPMPETALPEPEETMIAGGMPLAPDLPEPSVP